MERVEIISSHVVETRINCDFSDAGRGGLWKWMNTREFTFLHLTWFEGFCGLQVIPAKSLAKKIFNILLSGDVWSCCEGVIHHTTTLTKILIRI